MLKLPTSLFECVCFICVNIVSFSRLWGFCSPRLFITVFFQPNLIWSKQNMSPVEKVMRSVCPRWCTFLYFYFLIIRCFMDLFIFFLPEFYFSVYSALRFPAEVIYTIWRWSSNLASLNCAFGLPYIKINSLSAHHTRPWSQKRASFICSSHTFGHVSGPLVSLTYT